MRSMTGYGRRQRLEDGREMTVEVKTVNHRFLDIAARMPRALGFAEDALRKRVGETLIRGHADVFVNYRNLRQDARTVSCDAPLALAYRRALEELASVTGAQGGADVWRYAQLPDVLRVEEAQDDQQAVRELMLATLDDALRDVQEMREREGEALKNDLLSRLSALEALHGQIALRAPEVATLYRERLTQKIAECGAAQIDQQRIIQEVALFADRVAIDEELSRLLSHFAQARALMDDSLPCGAKMNFLVQEMNREVNTIGSKALDADITRMVVDAKSEIEKMREQIQNVE